ncbi:hypothetical protein DR950_34875 [Kitasatospora xanthocidica]|uniref:Uncharacterized protein n=1 Tax=Kitasatospora xanthocidica TaxID=83382 RepID=A0A373A272_9ACTN|nr:hypothetical protein [Kitasatospora xanthocidica]RGD62248.1 hypothetical protein DR950_34875 [Kitasatospora xanthocidica]
MTVPDHTASPAGDWHRLKPDTVLAVEEILQQLREDEANPQNLLDAYLHAKRLLADSMQALVRTTLPAECDAFRDLRKQLGDRMAAEYGERIPERYLTVPYGSRTHEELFAMLLRRVGQPVSAALLRVATRDSVHAERRTRELRELGLDIVTGREGGNDVYTLRSLDLDTSMIPTIITNNLRDKKAPVHEKNAVAAVLSGAAD